MRPSLSINVAVMITPSERMYTSISGAGNCIAMPIGMAAVARTLPYARQANAAPVHDTADRSPDQLRIDVAGVKDVASHP
jgi:hypothetical protein